MIQDAWTVTFSPDYSVAIWYGYDKLTKKTYNTSSHAWSERIKIQREIVNKVMKKNSRFKRPKSVVFARVAVGTNPPLLSSSGKTFLFVKGTQPTKRASTPKKSTTTTTTTTTTESTQ